MKGFTILEGMIILCIISIAFAIATPILNYTGMDTMQSTGTVVDKEYIAAYTSTMYIKSGNVLVPSTTHYPESYNITVDVDGLIDEISVSKDSYDTIKVGDWLKVIYKKGRLFNTISIISVIGVVNE